MSTDYKAMLESTSNHQQTVSSPTCTALLCCPFCLGSAVEVEDALSARFGYPKAIKCTSCGATHMNAKKWNERPTSKILRAS